MKPKSSTVFVLIIFLVLGLLFWMYYSAYKTESFDLQNFDQKFRRDIP